jgi:hypothetical protein
MSVTATKPIGSVRLSGPGADGVPPARPRDESAEWTFPVEGDLAWEVVLTDALGIASAEPFRVRIEAVPDEAPSILLAAEGVGPLVTRSARLPLTAVANDDYGLSAIELSYEAGLSDGQNASARQVLWQGDGDVQAAAEAVLDLARRDIGLGTALRLVASARDNCAPDGPNTGLSAPLGFRVVAAYELRAALLLTQHDLRRDLEQQMEAQRRVLAGLEGSADPADLAMRQRAIGAVLDSIGSGYRDVLAQMLNNGLLDDSQHARRSRAITEPLARLGGAHGMCAALADVIAGPSPGAVPPAAQSALAEMGSVRSAMMLLEGQAALLSSVEEIASQQEDILERTEGLTRSDLDALLGD